VKRLLTSDVVVTLDGRDHIHRPGYVLVADDRIEAVGAKAEWQGDADEIVELGGRLTMPGLVNAHTHTPMVLFRGQAEGRSLLTWEGWHDTIRVLEEVMTADMVPPAVLVSCAEMIRTGTTTFADQYFHMDRIAPAVRQSGLRASLAYGIVEMGEAAQRERELAAAEAFLDSVRGEPRLIGWLGPHAFFVDNSPEAIEREVELSERYATGLHFHLATSGEEDAYCQEHFGRSAVQQMQALGIMRRPLIAAHCITVPRADFDTLAEHEFTAVIAASACMKAGAEVAPLKAMREAGINTAIGTDNVTNNNSYDMFNEMQTTAKLMALRERMPGAVSAREILDMATRGGARALGLQDSIGSLEPGKKADLIALDYAGVGWPPDEAQDLYTALVYAATGMHVRDVMVDGQWLLKDGGLVTLDYARARTDLNSAYSELHRRRQEEDRRR
jgi:5-methylthioadenosine/S-adenosylhomocysteine deaminase